MNIEALFDRILTLNLIATTIVFYVTARIYLLPHLGNIASAHGSDSHSSSPLVAAPRIDVSDPRGHLSGLAIAVRLSGRFGRLAYSRASLRILLFDVLQLCPCTTSGMVFQCVWDSRFAGCNHSGDHLRSTSIHGTGLLDSRLLGPFTAGHPLHHVPCSYQALEGSLVRSPLTVKIKMCRGFKGCGTSASWIQKRALRYE